MRKSKYEESVEKMHASMDKIAYALAGATIVTFIGTMLYSNYFGL